MRKSGMMASAAAVSASPVPQRCAGANHDSMRPTALFLGS